MVSAIITTYKRNPTMVLRALDSVLSQSYKDIEVIIVDDSPNDYSLRENVRLAIKMRQKVHSELNIQYIQHDNNMGACVARNTGMKAARGEYIAYLDDDDEWLPEKIEKQMKVITKSKAALVYCGSICIDDETGKTINRNKEYIKGKVFKKLLYYNFIESTSYPLIRKECLKSIGGFDPLMQSAQDYDVWLRLSKRYEFDYVPEPLVRYHVHSGESITENPIKKISGLERINHKYAPYLEKDRQLWWKRNIGIARHYTLNGEVKKAITLWLKCVGKCPDKVRENTKYLIMIILAWKSYIQKGD